MKNPIYIAIASVAMVFTACSSESYHKDASVLPPGPRDVVENHFDAKVVSVKVEKNTFGEDEYNVTLNDGTTIEFDDEVWSEVKAGRGTSVPDYFVEAPIRTYITDNHPGLSVVKIDRDETGYEVELVNGLELKFNLDGMFVKYDD